MNLIISCNISHCVIYRMSNARGSTVLQICSLREGKFLFTTLLLCSKFTNKWFQSNEIQGRLKLEMLTLHFKESIIPAKEPFF